MLRRIIKKIWKGNTVYVKVGNYSPGDLLKDKVIVITGGSSGIGKEIAISCVKQGANVVIIGKNVDKLCASANEINDIHPACKSITWDISDFSILNQKIRACINAYGRIDCFVNNAGIYPGNLDYSNTSIKDFDRVININLKAPMIITNQVIKYMKDNHTQGNILTITSETAQCAYTNPYAISKAALSSYVKGIAYELRASSIRSNGIAPGVTVSEINKRDVNSNLEARTIIRRLLRPEEIACTAVFLLSDLSKCINGEIVTCNGGNCLPIEYSRVR